MSIFIISVAGQLSFYIINSLVCCEKYRRGIRGSSCRQTNGASFIAVTLAVWMGLVLGVLNGKFLVGSHCWCSWMLTWVMEILEELIGIDSGVFLFFVKVVHMELELRAWKGIFACIFFVHYFAILLLRKLLGWELDLRCMKG